MTKLYASLSVVLLALSVMSCSLFEVRSDTYSTSMEENPNAMYRGTATIAFAWGERLRPPQGLSAALVNLRDALTKYTRISSTVNQNLRLSSDDLFQTTFLVIASTESFELTPTELANVKTYLMNGGFILMDNVTSLQENSQSIASMRKMIRDALGSQATVKPIPNNHEIYHIVFDFDMPPTGSEVGVSIDRSAPDTGPVTILTPQRNFLDGVWIGNKLVAVISNKGYLHNWNEYSNNEPQLKFGVNMVIYALTSGGIGTVEKL